MFVPETKFLVVDDFATMRKIIKNALSELGYHNVHESDDGKNALSMLQSALNSMEPFGFVISDSNMPEMPGIDLLRHCKSDPQLKSLPFIILTAESEEKDVVNVVQAGASDYIVKPFDSATLKRKLEKAYRRMATKAA